MKRKREKGKKGWVGKRRREKEEKKRGRERNKQEREGERENWPQARSPGSLNLECKYTVGLGTSMD